MGSSTGVRHERQEVSSTPRVEGSSPVRGSFFFFEKLLNLFGLIQGSSVGQCSGLTYTLLMAHEHT